MAIEPWKPNSFLFDFVAIFIVVAFVVLVLTKLTLHDISPTTFLLIVVISPLATVIGRWEKIARAKRNNWVQEVPDTAESKQAISNYYDQTRLKDQRAYEVFAQASTQRAEEHANTIASEREKRAREVEALERELAAYRNIHGESEEDISSE